MQLRTDKCHLLESDQCSVLAETADIYLAETANSIIFQEVDINHITNNAIKKELKDLITNCKPNKIKATEGTVNITLTDDIAIAQRPR